MVIIAIQILSKMYATDQPDDSVGHFYLFDQHVRCFGHKQQSQQLR